MQEIPPIILSKNSSGQDLKIDTYQHTLLVAPNGSGKGVSHVLPILLSLDESVIVHDIKLENYEITSGYRASIGHKIYVFNPMGTKEKTHRYNPLDYVNWNSNEVVSDIQEVTDILVKGSSASKNLFTALILYLSVKKSPKTIGQVAKLLINDLGTELAKDFQAMHDKIHNFASEVLSGFLAMPHKMQIKLARELSDYLYPWNDPKIDYATSASDFDIASLKKEKATIYVGLNPWEIEKLKPVMSLFYDHASLRLLKAASSIGYGPENKGVTLLLDEFYSLGKLDLVISGAGYFRGYRIRLFLISADIESIESVYGEQAASNLISKCDYKIIFAPNNYHSAKYLSQICLDTKNNNLLQSPEALMNLDSNSQIIIQGKNQPLIVKKLKYFDDVNLEARVIKPAAL